MLKAQEVLEHYKSAVYEKDVEKFLTIYDPEIHLYDCWDNWEINGITQWKKNVEEWFNGLTEDGVLLKVDFHELKVNE